MDRIYSPENLVNIQMKNIENIEELKCNNC